MSSLIDIQKALARKDMPNKTFSIDFEEVESYTITVVAKDEDEARQKAWDEQNNGNYSSNSSGADITNIEIED